ncbi:MAG: GNAT family N-acetyltransferase [Anaerolineae bacterium]|nr:GNAT family N-acetyltransferase [Anaerolineae bacterium]
MPPRIASLADPQAALAPKANLLELLHFMARSPLAQLTEGDGWTRWWMPIPHPWFSGIRVAPTASAESGALIGDTVAYFQRQGAPAFTWWLDADVAADPWAAALAAHGFRYAADTPGMAAEMAALPAEAPTPRDFRSMPVSDSPTLRVWADVFIAGYELPPAWAAGFFQLLDGLPPGPPILNYLGYLGETPVTASSLFLGERVAGIYNVATLPEARRQGLGAAITLAPLRDAQAQGYHVAVLQSSPLGYGVYERLGFRRTCAVDCFYWSSETREDRNRD